MCCTQYANKFEKLSSGHRTGKGQFSFQSQRRAMPKNVQTMAQLHSSHMLAKKCSKFSNPSFSSRWTMKFQMFKLDFKMTNLDSILKSRDITLLTKIRLVKAMVFPVVMYEYETWTIKKAEHWRTDALEMYCWRRLLRVPCQQGDPTSPS